jgi:hypothetical protein
MSDRPQKKSSPWPVILGIGVPVGIGAALYRASKSPLSAAQLRNVMAGQSPSTTFASTAIPGSVKIGERSIATRETVNLGELGLEEVVAGIKAPETITDPAQIAKYIESQMTGINKEGVQIGGKTLLPQAEAKDVLSTLERLKGAAALRGGRDISLALTPGYGLRMTMSEAGRRNKIHSVELPMIFGHRGVAAGINYEAGAYYVGGGKIQHFMDALVEMSVMKTGKEAGLGAFMGGLEESIATMRGTLRGVMHPGNLTQVEAAHRATLFHMPLQSKMEMVGGIVGPGWEDQFSRLFPDVSFKGIKSAHDARAKIMAREYGMLPNTALQALGITAPRGTREFADQITMGVSALGGGGEHVLAGMIRPAGLGVRGIFPSISAHALQEGGRPLRQASMVRSNAELLGIGGGILGNEGLVLGSGMRELHGATSKFGGPRNTGFAARGMYIVSPKWAAAMGMDPVAGGGAIVASARAQEALMSRVHVGFRIPVKNGKVLANPKLSSMIQTGIVPEGGIMLRGGEAVGIGAFFSHDLDKELHTPGGVSRLIRTRGDVKFTNLPKLNPEGTEYTLEGEMLYYPETVSVMGKHASIARGLSSGQLPSMEYGAFAPGAHAGLARTKSTIAAAALGKGGLGPVEILTNVNEAKPEEFLQTLYQTLAYQTKDPRKAAETIEKHMSSEGASLEGYLSLAKQFGVAPLYDEKTKSLVTRTLGPDEKRLVGKMMGWSEQEINAYAKEEARALDVVFQMRPSQFPSEYWPGLVNRSGSPDTLRMLVNSLKSSKESYARLSDLTPESVAAAEMNFPEQYRWGREQIEASVAAHKPSLYMNKEVAIRDFLKTRMIEVNNEIGNLGEEIKNWHIMKQTTHPISLGWRELSMITDREGYQELAQHLISSMKTTEGSAGKEFAALFGQFGFNDMTGAVDPRSLAHAGGAYETIALGSDKLQNMAAEAKLLKDLIETEGYQAKGMSQLYQKFERGFMLETGGKSIQIELKRAKFGGKPVSVGSALAGDTGPVYVPGLAETVPKARLPGDLVYPERIMKSKLDLLIALGGYHNFADEPSRTASLRNIGDAMTDVLTAHAGMMTKHGGIKDIAGLQYVSETTAFGRLAGHEIVQRGELLKALEGPGYIRSMDVSKSIGELREANAATMFISRASAKHLPLAQYEKLMRGELYAMTGRYPVAGERSINAVKVAISNELSRGAMSLSRALRNFLGADLDGDAVGAWFFGNSKVEDDLLKKAYNTTLKEAQILEKQYDIELEKMGGEDAIKKALNGDIIDKLRKDNDAAKELFDKLVEAKGPEGALEHVIAGKIARSTFTGYISNQVTMYDEIINMNAAREGANKAASQMAKDVLGSVLTEGNIRMAKHAASGPQGIAEMAAYRLHEALTTPSSERAQRIQDVLTDINNAMIAKEPTSEQAALVKQLKSKVKMEWGLGGRSLIEAAPSGLSPVAEVLASAAAGKEAYLGTGGLGAMVMKGFLFGRMGPGTEDVTNMLGQLYHNAKTPEEIQIRAALFEEGMVDKNAVSRLGSGGASTIAKGGSPFKAPLGAATTATARIDELLGKIPDKWWPAISIGAAAALGMYALGRTVGAFRQPPPQPEGMAQQGGGEPLQQQVYVKGGFRQPFQQVPGNQRVEIRGASGNIDMLRQMIARSGTRMNIRDDSSSDQEFQRRLSQDQSSRFRGM